MVLLPRNECVVCVRRSDHAIVRRKRGGNRGAPPPDLAGLVQPPTAEEAVALRFFFDYYEVGLDQLDREQMEARGRLDPSSGCVWERGENTGPCHPKTRCETPPLPAATPALRKLRHYLCTSKDLSPERRAAWRRAIRRARKQSRADARGACSLRRLLF